MAETTSATQFTQSIGVNAAMDFFDTPYANSAAVAADLSYLGVGTVRDALPASDPTSLAPYAVLASQGIKFDLVAATGGGTVDLATVKSELDAFETQFPGSITSVEGMNEPNIWSYSYGGQTGVDAANAFQSDLSATVVSDPLLAGVRVIDYPWGGVDSGTYAAAGDQADVSALGNVHVYPDGEGDGTPDASIMEEDQLAAPYSAGHAIAVTEFGYSTVPGGDVSQLSQAQFELDGLMDASKNGMGPVDLYELLDGDSSNGNTDIEAHYGLFLSDATTPKTAATAIHNLTSILADPGSSAASTPAFNPSVSDLPSGAQTELLGKSDGTVDMLIWNETAQGTSQVQVNFGAAAATAAVYDPVTGNAPIQSVSGSSSLTLSLGADPLVVALSPTGSAGAAATAGTTAAVASASASLPSGTSADASADTSVVSGSSIADNLGSSSGMSFAGDPAPAADSAGQGTNTGAGDLGAADQGGAEYAAPYPQWQDSGRSGAAPDVAQVPDAGAATTDAFAGAGKHWHDGAAGLGHFQASGWHA